MHFFGYISHCATIKLRTSSSLIMNVLWYIQLQFAWKMFQQNQTLYFYFYQSKQFLSRRSFLLLVERLKPSLSTKILSINDFITKLLSKLLRDFSNKVHLKSISKFINKVINRYFFCKWTLKNRSIYKNIVC